MLVLPSSIYRSALGGTVADWFRIGFGRRELGAAPMACRAHLLRSDR